MSDAAHIKHLEQRVEMLEYKNAKLERIQSALIERIEGGGSALRADSYAAFEHSVLLVEQVRARTSELTEVNQQMRQEISERCAVEGKLRESKQEAEQVLISLKEAQEMLIQTEKLASLGRLVAGIAHEINTPVGNSRTIVSALGIKLKMFHQEFESGLLKRSSLGDFLASLDEAMRILDSSLDRAAEQISNFKQVAVDQTSAQQRCFDLREVVDEVIYTLRPHIKHTQFNVEVDVPDGIELNSFPGPLGQIITNCFNNALIHGFEGRDQGCIKISARRKSEHDILLEISDDGIGMSAAEIKKAFDPFFTTKMGRGGSGLGLHIVFNLVNTVLRGSVELDSAQGQGFKLIFRIPKQVLADA